MTSKATSLGNPVIRLPWKSQGRWREEDFNDALAWILQAEPLAASGLAAAAGVDMVATKPIKIRVRSGGSGVGQPDLVLTGENARGNVTRVVVELKTSLGTGLTEHEREGYPRFFDGIPSSRRALVLVGPPGYVPRHTKPASATFWTHRELREHIEAAFRDQIAGALLADMWLHFFGVDVAVADIPNLMAGTGYATLWAFLRPLLVATNARENLVAGRIVGTRNNSLPWYGMHIKKGGSQVAWVGFVNDEGKGHMELNIRSKKVFKAVKQISGGTTYKYDAGQWFAGSWYPTGEVLTPERVLADGLGEALDLLSDG